MELHREKKITAASHIGGNPKIVAKSQSYQIHKVTVVPDLAAKSHLIKSKSLPALIFNTIIPVGILWLISMWFGCGHVYTCLCDLVASTLGVKSWTGQSECNPPSYLSTCAAGQRISTWENLGKKKCGNLDAAFVLCPRVMSSHPSQVHGLENEHKHWGHV